MYLQGQILFLINLNRRLENYYLINSCPNTRLNHVFIDNKFIRYTEKNLSVQKARNLQQNHSYFFFNCLKTLQFYTKHSIIMRKIIKKGQELTHGPMPNEIMQPLCGYQNPLHNRQSSQNNQMGKMVDQLHQSPISARMDESKERATPTQLFQNSNSQGQLSQPYVKKTDLISTPRSQKILQGTAKNRNSFNARIGGVAAASGATKLTFSDQRLKECTIKPLPSPSINIMKPRSVLNLSLDQISQDNLSSRTAKACQMTRQSNRGRPNQSPGAINRSKNLSVIDEIDELFQKNQKSVAHSRRQSKEKQQDATESSHLIQKKQIKIECELDTVSLTNHSKNQQLNSATVTPPLRCADKAENGQIVTEQERLRRLCFNSRQLQIPFERLQISQQEEVEDDKNNTLFHQQDQEMIVYRQNGDRIQNIQQKNKKDNAINTAYYQGFQGLHQQHHLVQEQAAQISGNKTKSHLPDDFVHVKNFKNLDSMHTNIRDNSPENLLNTRKTEEYFFEQAIEVDKKKSKLGSCARISENDEDSGSLMASEASDTEFWPQNSKASNLQSNCEASQDLDGTQISKNKTKKNCKRQDSVITDLDSIMMTDSIDQIVEVTPNNIIYNQCQHGHSRCQGGSRAQNSGSKVSHGSKKKQNNQFRNQLNDQNQNQQKEQQNKAAQQPMEQRDNYVSRVRISSLTRTHNQNQSSNSPEEDSKLQPLINTGEQGQGQTQLQGAYLAPQSWTQPIHPFQSKFTPSVKLTGAQLDDPSVMISLNTGPIGVNQTTHGSIASRFFGQNQQEFQQQSTQLPDEHEENIDEELVNFKSAIQQFNTIGHKIQQQQNQQMNIIQRVMDDDLANSSSHLLNASGFRQLNPFQVNNYLTNNLSQALTLPAIDRLQTPRLDACEEDQVNAFARKSSVAATNPIMPMFMQKNHSSSKENSGESSLPNAGTQNPLTRLRQEIRNQQSNQNLYEQIQLLAEQLKLSQQMMSVEGSEINIYQEDKMQMLQQLKAQIKNKQLVTPAEPHRSQSQSQHSTGNFVQQPSARQDDPQRSEQPQEKPASTPQQRASAKTLSFIEQNISIAEDQQSQQQLLLLQSIQEAKQAMSSSVIAGLVEQANKGSLAMEDQTPEPKEEEGAPVQVQVLDEPEEGVICISRNKNMIKKRSFVEVQKRSQNESTGVNDRCLSEHKSSGRYKKKWAKSEYLEQSNQRMREESIDEVQHSDHQSVGQKSGSSQLRSAKSLRKKNIQLEKSTFSARKKFDEIIDDQSIDQSQQRNAGHMPIPGFTLLSSPEQAQANQSSQPSALQKMIGPLTISERHQRILRFIHKKHNKTQAKKFTYECRKSVAEKRLRIKGRFVTKQQAFQILGLKENDIQSNEALQRLLEQHYNINNQTGTQIPFNNRMSQIMHFQLSKKQGALLGNPLAPTGQSISEDMLQAKNGRSTIQVSSLIQNADGSNRTIKIRNFQALFDQAYSNQASFNDTTLNEAVMTGNEENSHETHNSYSDSKESPQQQICKLTASQPAFSQAFLNCGQMSLLGSKMSMYNAASAGGSSEYYSQQMGVLEMQHQLRLQDEQNASATNSLLEGLVQPPMFKVERMTERDDLLGALKEHGEGSEREESFANKYDHDSESLCNDEEVLEED